MVKIKNSFNILNFLINHKNEGFSIREISNILKLDYKTTYTTINKISNSIDINKKSNSNFISYKAILTDEIYLLEKHRQVELLKRSNFKIIHEELSKINQQFILLLFGSYAKNTQTKNSDIDILLISTDAEIIIDQLQILPLPIHVTSISTKQFISMLNSKKISVVSEAVKNNIILFGIEDYYRFLQNVN